MRKGVYGVLACGGNGAEEIYSPLTADVAQDVATSLYDGFSADHPDWDESYYDIDGTLYSPDGTEWFAVRVVHLSYDLGVNLG